MATVRPGVMQALAEDASKTGTVEVFDAGVSEADMNIKIREVVKDTKKTVDITEAKILVSGRTWYRRTRRFWYAERTC